MKFFNRDAHDTDSSAAENNAQVLPNPEASNSDTSEDSVSANIKTYDDVVKLMADQGSFKSLLRSPMAGSLLSKALSVKKPDEMVEYLKKHLISEMETILILDTCDPALYTVCRLTMSQAVSSQIAEKTEESDDDYSLLKAINECYGFNLQKRSEIKSFLRTVLTYHPKIYSMIRNQAFKQIFKTG